MFDPWIDEQYLELYFSFVPFYVLNLQNSISMLIGLAISVFVLK